MALMEKYEKDSAAYSSWKGMMGPRGKVDEKTRHIAAATAWGLFPEWDATYLNYSGGHDTKVGRKATYEVPENKAFWSITVYGRDGFMKSDNNVVTSSNVKLNPDGKALPSSLTFTPPDIDYDRGGFWSITTYDKEGWIARDKAAISNMEARPNPDGTYTNRFNSPGEPNNIDTPTPFTVLLRVYVPKSKDEISRFLPKASKELVIQ